MGALAVPDTWAFVLGHAPEGASQRLQALSMQLLTDSNWEGKGRSLKRLCSIARSKVGWDKIKSKMLTWALAQIFEFGMNPSYLIEKGKKVM